VGKDTTHRRLRFLSFRCGCRGRFPWKNCVFRLVGIGFRGEIIGYGRCEVNLEFGRDESGNILGPDVKLVMTLFDGDVVVKYMPAMLATLTLLYGDENGIVFRSGHIEHRGLMDVWGTSA